MSENARVGAGLSLANVGWAFTSGFAANWFPLTWLSHMLDAELFGVRPGPAHLVNVIFHLLNSWLLFAVVRRLTGTLWRSAVVAGLFAVHPLHVESVAWIAERKDVLSTFFGLLTIWAYVGWVRAHSWGRYALMLFAFACGLMAKPMLVTLPFLLMLLDVWPLGRAQLPRYSSALVKEKLPLFILAAMSSVITVLVQHKAGAVQALEGVSLSSRVVNAVAAYALYLAKTIWPTNLSVFYPFRTIPVWQIAVSVAALSGLTVICWRQRRDRPYLIVGWLWFIGMLVPVIGLVQVGSQAMADRYTYLSNVGLFIAGVWLVASMTPRTIAATAAVVSAAVFTFLSARQAATWTSSLTLWEHAYDVSNPNPYAETALASALADAGERDRASALFAEVLALKPNVAEVHNDYAQMLVEQGRGDQAIQHFHEAVRLNPKYAEAYHNLGVALLARGETDPAVENFEQALHLNPDLAKTHSAIGDALARQGKLDDAVAHLQTAMQLKPLFGDPHNNLGKIRAGTGHPDEALSEFSEAIRLDPKDAEAYYNRGVVLLGLQRAREAASDFQVALRLDPTLAGAHNNLGNALSALGDLDRALAEFNAAVSADPSQPDFRFNLAAAFARRGRLSEAIAQLQEALRRNPSHEPARQLLSELERRIKK